MSRRGPRAHVYRDGVGGMVTGTHDVTTARRLMVAEWIDQECRDPEAREDVAEASRLFRARDARLETGRFVPVDPYSRDDGYVWFWRSGYALGKPGVTRAVVWTW